MHSVTAARPESITRLGQTGALAVWSPRPVETSGLQRNFGTVGLTFSISNDAPRATRMFQEGALKVRLPNVISGRPPEAILLNIAGGMTGGDRQAITVGV